MIFVDTGALVGRYLPKDQHHENAIVGWQQILSDRIPYGTSNFVITETLTLIGRKASYRFAVETGRLIYSASTLKIWRPDLTDETQALSFFEKLADQKVSFTDCVSFSLMRRHRVTRVFGFDHHFEAAGFSIWPGK